MRANAIHGGPQLCLQITLKAFCLSFVGLLLATPALALPVPANYQYPINNPFEATIATTPPALAPQGLPTDEHIDQDDYTLSLIPDRQYSLPDNFWAVKKLKYRIARQPGPAPMIFLIAGTGANYSSATMEFLKRVFYRAGYHVVQISSPTSYDFMASASRYATPGYSPEDARDLYKVMTAIKAAQSNVAVTDYFLAGYSLGALDAAFVSRLDEDQKQFNFKRVLLLNPAVNLLSSTKNLDKLVYTDVKGVSDTQTFYDVILKKLATFYHARGGVDLNAAMLYDFQSSDQRLSDEELAMLIGAVFRFSAADIVFTSDVVNQRGEIVPKGTVLKEGTSLTPYFRNSLTCNFDCYISRQLLPMWHDHFQGINAQDFFDQVNLNALEPYLKQSPKIGVMTNADDIILGTGDLGFLRRTFGDRLTVFPNGGHLGNLNYTVNVEMMLEFFRE